MSAEETSGPGVENHEEMRRKLDDRGYAFTSDTDNEVIAHLHTVPLQLLAYRTAIERGNAKSVTVKQRNLCVIQHDEASSRTMRRNAWI